MSLLSSLRKLDQVDFRVKGRIKYKASEIAATTVCSIVCGGTSYYDFENFGREREAWLRQFLELRNGIPSHDAFRYFWTHLAPARLNACFMEWVEEYRSGYDGDGVHIDGKCIRLAPTPDGRVPCIVSAYSSKDRIVVGQRKADDKSNEITALPMLIASLRLLGAVVTIDAAGCQRKVVKAIVGGHADYLISLKGNQGTMHEEVKELFADGSAEGAEECSETEKGHGRVTTWRCVQTDDLGWFADKDKWAGLKSVCMVETETFHQKTGETTRDVRHFISSLDVEPERALRLARGHWDVENPLHWTLDMVFDEDHSRARCGFSAENIGIVRHMGFNMIRRDKGTEGGISRRKKTLTWNEEKMLRAILAA